jgi:carboxyl-terminal processing protease
VVEEELPEELKQKAETQEPRGEANLRGHLRGDEEGEDDESGPAEEESGSSSYVPADKEKDTQLKYGLDLLRGIKSVDTEAKKKAEAN